MVTSPHILPEFPFFRLQVHCFIFYFYVILVIILFFSIYLIFFNLKLVIAKLYPVFFVPVFLLGFFLFGCKYTALYFIFYVILVIILFFSIYLIFLNLKLVIATAYTKCIAFGVMVGASSSRPWVTPILPPRNSRRSTKNGENLSTNSIGCLSIFVVVCCGRNTLVTPG